ncbi:hypothetical protein PORY_000567 [Pneumocystis oryctolagi]|uniref:Uncharacterized protein n=1 Tax=Pneumocystis oryctolagi TaxID=42067 RepID=A0ACB7CFL9_9ASCO|nr:hypothetical protein PORY_000567 [Pneumocystis oryctolagi]
MKEQENSEFFFSEKILDICSVLNDPCQKECLKKSTTKDISSVSLTPIPKYEISDFQIYLSKISSNYKRYSLNKKDKVTEKFQESELDISKLKLNKHDKYPLDCSSMSFNSSSESSDFNRENISQVLSEEVLQSMEISLSSVPSVYFKSNFELENSRIFDLVTDNASVFSQSSAPGECKTLLNNTILQEKLSWYLDIVEIHLIKEINNASSLFFVVIDHLQDLYKDSSSCIDKIKDLKNKLVNNNNVLVEPRLKIMEIVKKKENLDKLDRVLMSVYRILLELSEVRNLIKKNDYIFALNMIEKIDNKMRGNLDDCKDVSLSSITALSSVTKELKILTEDIKDKLSLEFTNILIEDHRRIILSVSSEVISDVYLYFKKNNKIHRNINVSSINLDHDLRKKIEIVILGISITNSVEAALNCYRDAILKEIKDIIVQNLCKNNEFVNFDQLLSSIANDYMVFENVLKEITPEEFLQMLGIIYAKVYLFLQRLLVYQKLLLDITLELADRSNVDKSISIITIDISNILITATDFSQLEIIKILNIRAPQNTKLSRDDMFRFFSLHSIFLTLCETLTGKFGELLHKTILSQIKESINNYHIEKISLETSILDKDQWIPKEEITEEFQNTINCIVDSAIVDPIFWKKDFLFNETENIQSNIDLANIVDKNLKSVITIKNENYYITESLISLFLIVEDYEKILVLIPPIAYDITNNILELLELYNFKVYQLILGAGAIKTAGLKTITAKHLALASHSISIAYEEHQEQIHLKFISIMSSRLDSLVNSPSGLKHLDWSKELSKTDDGNLKPHIYIESLVKDTLTLYKVLKKYLKHDIIQNIMIEILNIYVDVLLKEFSNLSLETEGFKDNVLVDLEYFADNLRVFGTIGEEAGCKIIKNVKSMFEEKQE